MNALARAWIVDNAAWADARPRLSVLIPFMRDDPCRLLAALDGGSEAEIVVLDDGTGDDALAARVAEAVTALRTPARFIRLVANEGRSKGRNRLTSHARARHFLFLDSDMLPDSSDFMARWLEAVEADPAAAFGGFTLDQTPARPEHALHRAMASRSDCLPLEERRKAGAKAVFTSNLLVRRDIFESEAFDEGFQGWGWEDVEWAIRVAKRHDVIHIDNTATHLGLDPAPVIARKFEQSAANFARVLSIHPEVVSEYPSYRVARLLRRAPLRSFWRPVVKAIALAGAGPVALRAFAMRLYRASLYAEVVA